MSEIRIVGPRDQRQLRGDWLRIDTTSGSTTEWTTQLSPFFLGPCPLYGGRTARIMENGWQFAKAYKSHVDAAGSPTDDYWRWARQGWSASRSVRHPMGKGAKPEYLLWNDKKLGYVEGRHEVYWPMYRDAVAKTEAFARLQELFAGGRSIAMFDFDGYDHDACGIPLANVLLDDRRPMGHAFVLKSMLMYGADVTPAQVIDAAVPPAPAPAVAAADQAPQFSLFGADETPPSASLRFRRR